MLFEQPENSSGLEQHAVCTAIVKWTRLPRPDPVQIITLLPTNSPLDLQLDKRRLLGGSLEVIHFSLRPPGYHHGVR